MTGLPQDTLNGPLRPGFWRVEIRQVSDILFPAGKAKGATVRVTVSPRLLWACPSCGTIYDLSCGAIFFQDGKGFLRRLRCREEGCCWSGEAELLDIVNVSAKWSNESRKVRGEDFGSLGPTGDVSNES